MRVACVNVKGMNKVFKRREVCEMITNGKLDVLSLSKSHLKGCGVWGCGSKIEKMLQDGLEEGLVWTGVEKGKGKEGCA